LLPVVATELVKYFWKPTRMTIGISETNIAPAKIMPKLTSYSVENWASATAATL